MLRQLFTALSAVVTFPPRLAHEATHAALSAPHADDWRLDLHPLHGRASVVVDRWETDAPRWGIVLAHLGPVICGALLGVLTLAYVLLVGVAPTNVSEWMTVAILTAWWSIYTAPSGGDLAVFDTGGVDDAAE